MGRPGPERVSLVAVTGSRPAPPGPCYASGVLTAEDVIARVFTTPNPETGSQPPPEIAWVVFAQGTVFFSEPTDALPASASAAEIGEAGKAALRDLGPVQVGTSSADFRTARLDGWFPDERVWFVGFDHPNIATIVVADMESMTAGFEARSLRQRDHDEQTVVCVRGFDGTVTRTP